MTYGMVRMPGTVTALSPLAHNGDTPGGNATRLRHQVIIVDGVQRKMPYISGNAVRGYLRRRAMTDMLRRIDYTVDVTKAGGKRLWHAMYSGGILEKEKTPGMDLAAKRKIYATIPMVRLFGWAWGNQMIESKMKVANMMPICIEIDGGDNPPIRRCTHTIYHTRRDDRQVESDETHQMIYNTEVFVTGTKFRHEFALEDPTDLDLSALCHVIGLWREYPTIGGKSAIGLGSVDIQYDYGRATPDAYVQYLKDNAATIRTTLDGLASS